MINDEFLGENCSFYHINHIIIYKKQKTRLEMNGFFVLYDVSNIPPQYISDFGCRKCPNPTSEIPYPTSKGVNHVSYFKSYVTTLSYLRAIFTYSNL